MLTLALLKEGDRGAVRFWNRSACLSAGVGRRNSPDSDGCISA